MLTKVAFAEEWASSLKESHPDSQGRTLALDTFHTEVAFLKRELGKVLPDLNCLPGSRADFSWV